MVKCAWVACRVCEGLSRMRGGTLMKRPAVWSRSSFNKFFCSDAQTSSPSSTPLGSFWLLPWSTVDSRMKAIRRLEASAADAAYLLRWEGECLSRLEGLVEGHEKARLELEGQLESQMQPSSYSPHLIDLMAREERAANQGTWETYKQLAGRVDRALSGELDQHFRARSQIHQRQWIAMYERQLQDRDKFSADITNQILELASSLRVPTPPTLGDRLDILSASPEALQRLDARPMSQLQRLDVERRIRRQSMKHWGENERFNLQEALALQIARVESEWGSYLAQIEEDYRTQRAAKEAKIEGADSTKRASVTGITRKSSVTDIRAGPWRNKEKQSRLVHTAPVLTPETFGGTKRPKQSGRAVPKQKTSAITLGKELSTIDNAYRASVKRVEHQRAMASRWINRQAMRMHAHLQHVEKDKEAILGYLEKEEVEVEAIRGWIDTFAARAREVVAASMV